MSTTGVLSNECYRTLGTSIRCGASVTMPLTVVLVIFDIAGLALLLSLLLTPVVRDFCKRRNMFDHPDSGRKLHASPIPRLGGVAVIGAYLLAMAFVAIAPYSTTKVDVMRGLERGLALAPAVALIFLTGVVDDLRGLSPWQKLSCQVVAAALAYQAGFGIESLNGYDLPVWVGLPVSVMWIVGLTNALNLVDGIDGLAAGAGLFATLTSLIAALINHNMELALVTAPLAGALLGFLRYNFNPASIFLGDSGSLTVGFLLGCFGAVWSHKSATMLGLTAPLLAVSIPLLEMGTSIVRRFLRGQPIFSSDRGHIHHRLLDMGMTPRKAVLLLYAVCGAAAVLSLLQEMAQEQIGGFIIVLFCAAAWMGVQHLGYTEFDVARKVILRGGFRGVVNVQLALRKFEQELETAPTFAEAKALIRNECPKFGFHAVEFFDRSALSDDATVSDEVANNSWRLYLPLSPGRSVCLLRSRDSAINPLVFANFAECVERLLSQKVEVDVAPVVMFTGDVRPQQLSSSTSIVA